MEGKLSTTILLLVVSVMMTSTVNALTDAECSDRMMQCSNTATNTLASDTATNQEKCQALKDSLTCLTTGDTSSCVSDIFFRILFLRAINRGVNMSLGCDRTDFDNTFYPAISQSSDPCPQNARDCVLDYVDKRMARNENPDTSDLRYGLCQDLSEFVACRLENSCLTKEQLMSIVSEEEKGMQVDCVIPLLTDSYDFQECGIAIGQCNTLRDYLAQDVCPSISESLTCTVDLGCANDVWLRLIKLDAEETVQVSSSQNCDSQIDAVFAQVEQTSNECEVELRKCVDDYVDLLREKHKADPQPTQEELCNDLNDFLECVDDLDDMCKPSETEVKELFEDEIERMRLTKCSNHGIKMTSGISMILLCLLVSFIKHLV